MSKEKKYIGLKEACVIFGGEKPVSEVTARKLLRRFDIVGISNNQPTDRIRYLKADVLKANVDRFLPVVKETK